MVTLYWRNFDTCSHSNVVVHGPFLFSPYNDSLLVTAIAILHKGIYDKSVIIKDFNLLMLYEYYVVGHIITIFNTYN